MLCNCPWGRQRRTRIIVRILYTAMCANAWLRFELYMRIRWVIVANEINTLTSCSVVKPSESLCRKGVNICQYRTYRLSGHDYVWHASTDEFSLISTRFYTATIIVHSLLGDPWIYNIIVVRSHGIRVRFSLLRGKYYLCLFVRHADTYGISFFPLFLHSTLK